jgi:hypothetical protein
VCLSEYVWVWVWGLNFNLPLALAIGILNRLKEHALRNVYLYIVIFFLVIILTDILLVGNFSLSLISIIPSVIVILLGQILIFTTFSVAYFFYVGSFFSVLSFTLLYWMARHFPNDPLFYVFYLTAVSVIFIVPFAVHWYTKKRARIVPLIPLFSIAFFCFVFLFGVSGSIEASTVDKLFNVAMLLFIITSIFGFNSAWRTMILHRNLGISDRNKYLRKLEDDLLKKYDSEEEQVKVNMLIYYLSASLDSFVEGDFERSFMDGYKIAFDLNGKAFEMIYVLPTNDERQKHFSETRNLLSHARVSSRKKGIEKTKEEKYDFEKLKNLQKNLFGETLDLLKIVKKEFIEGALKKSSQ